MIFSNLKKGFTIHLLETMSLVNVLRGVFCVCRIRVIFHTYESKATVSISIASVFFTSNPLILPFITNKRKQSNIIIPQQDNAPPHKANIVNVIMIENYIQVLTCPAAVSPDINCIENLCATLGRALRTQISRPTNGGELFHFLQTIQNEISEETFTTTRNQCGVGHYQHCCSFQ